jgi:parvulin-like peptidyl-prolyl isomerase
MKFLRAFVFITAGTAFVALFGSWALAADKTDLTTTPTAVATVRPAETPSAAATSVTAAASASTASKAVPAGTTVSLDRVEIRVGSEIVTTQEIEVPLQQLELRLTPEFRGKELAEKLALARKQHIERLIEGALLVQEARDQKIEVQDAQVDEQAQKEIESLRAQFPTPQDFDKQLKREHLTLDELRKQRSGLVKENILRQRLLQGKMEEFKTTAEISEEQLKTYYQKHPEEFRKPAQAKLSQIFVAVPDPGLSGDEFKRLDGQARAKIARAMAELKRGRDFAAVAREYSEHKITAEKGGEIGFISQGDTSLPEFDKVVFNKLKVGETSGVIETARGYFVVKLEDKQAGGPMPMEEVKGLIRQKMMSEGSEKRYQAWIQTLKDKYKVIYADKI